MTMAANRLNEAPRCETCTLSRASGSTTAIRPLVEQARIDIVEAQPIAGIWFTVSIEGLDVVALTEAVGF